MKEKILKTEKGSFFIRHASDVENYQILDLFKEVFKKKIAPYWWYWKYKLNPFGSFSFVCVKYPENKLIVHAGALRIPIYLEGQIFFALQVVDCMSHPKFRAYPVRKKGVFVLTMNLLFDNTVSIASPYVFGFAGERHFLLGEKLLAYRRLNKVVEYTILPGQKGKGKIREIDTKEFLELVSNRAFYREDAEILKFCILKTPAYLKWRYLDSPINYKFFTVGNSSIAIIREERDICYVVDILGVKSLRIDLLELSGYLNKKLKLWLPEGHFLNSEVSDLGKKIVLESVYACEKIFWDNFHIKKPRTSFFYLMGDSDLF